MSVWTELSPVERQGRITRRQSVQKFVDSDVVLNDNKFIGINAP